MTSAQIRQSFLDFFQSKQHTIVPSSSLMPDSPNLLFTNAGMNQFVPIFLGQVKRPYTPGRAADTQKCIRAGGKHNDLDDVGLDTYHHTFFEMLGNWSFGDYFKKDAIDWAWELVIEVWKFPPSRLYATIYNPDKAQGDPSERDEEAWNFWAGKFRAVGLDPAVHIVNGNKKDNFWMMGETGPCGPCSELHVDLTPLGDTRGALVNQGDARCIEIWNLVFIQFNANPDGSFSPLPAQHVDTGMGFERVTSIMQGTKGLTDFANAKISNYETDIFRPIFDVLEKMSGKTYRSTLPGGQKEPVLASGAPSNSETVENQPNPTSLEQTQTRLNPLKTSLKPFQTSLKPFQTSLNPSQTGLNPLQTSLEPSQAGLNPRQTSLEPSQTSLKPSQTGLTPLGTTPEQAGSAPARPSEISNPQSQIAIDIAFRVIADHIRTLSFAIADGIQPGIKGRNGVLRSIHKRMLRYASTIGVEGDKVLDTQDVLVETLARTMGDVFPNVRAQKEHIKKVLRAEADVFNKTLDKGIAQFDLHVGIAMADCIEFPGIDLPTSAARRFELGRTRAGESFPVFVQNAKALYPDCKVSREPELSGLGAFTLYDTYGFPLDLTELMARERGLTVDVTNFNQLMDEQKKRSQEARVTQVIELSQVKTTAPTKFIGYDNLETQTHVLEVVSLKDKTAVILDASACYAEMGGQVGDTGELSGSGQLWRVTNTQKSGNAWLHLIEGGDAPAVGATVTLAVEKPRRHAIQRHHTVTHLLHWALHEVASKEASQKGSFVGPDKLTFDFNSAPLTPAQVADIEKLVNERILENAAVAWTEVPHADVKNRKDVMQFFGDKYGDVVRVVQIGGAANKLDGYSMELCGGTHTRATGEIGLFRILGENAIAAGVRRIEAVAGLTAYDVMKLDRELIKTVAGRVNSPVHELEKKIESLLAHQKELEKQVEQARQRNASNAASELLGAAQIVNGIPIITHNLGEADGDFLQAIADSLKSRFKGVVVLGGLANDAVTLIASVSPDFTAKVQAGKIIQAIAPIVGGKGGGKLDHARGGGKDASKLDEALNRVKTLLAG